MPISLENRCPGIKIDNNNVHIDPLIRRGTTNIRCSKQFTPDVHTRRKKALAVRHDLKLNNKITKGFIDYPAKLMVVLPGADRYSLHSSH